MTIPSTSTNRSSSSPQSLRLLGNAIALAAFTCLLAYGCEKARNQSAAPALSPATQQPAPAKPAAPGASKPADPPAPSPAAPTAQAPAPVTADPPQTLVPPKPGEQTGAKPAEPETPEAPKARPIPHDDLARDAKPLKEFTTPTNVIVQEIRIGQGAPTLPKAVVTMHFVIHLKDDWKKIQSTYDDGATETYQLEEMVLGMSDGLIGMQPGAVRRLIVPPERAFGAAGAKDRQGQYVIPPSATLVYDIELLSNKQKIVDTPRVVPAPPKFNAGRKDEPGK